MSRTKSQDIHRLLNSLPQKLRDSIQRLREMQEECENLNLQHRKEIRSLEAKYKKLYDPIYDARTRLIQGIEANGLQSVPGFWLKVFLSSSHVGSTITKQDEEILKYLVDVRSSSLPNDKPGFEVTFQFTTNPFFKHKTLTKSYILGDHEDDLLESATGSVIEWNEGKNPKLTSKWRHGRQLLVETNSFFDFFQPLQLPAPDAHDDLDFEQIHYIQETLEEDFEIGLVIKDSLIPKAVFWFTGEIADLSSSDEESGGCSSKEAINTEDEE